SSALSLSPKFAMPRDTRAPFSTTWSKPSCEYSSGDKVRFGKLERCCTAFVPWQTEQFSSYTSPPRAITSADAVDGGGFSSGGVYVRFGGSDAVPPSLNTSMRP